MVNQVETFKSESEALFRVQWLIRESYKVSVWYEGEGVDKVVCITYYSMI